MGNEPQDAERTPAYRQRDADVGHDACLPERWKLAVILPGVLDDHELAALCRDAWYALPNRRRLCFHLIPRRRGKIMLRGEAHEPPILVNEKSRPRLHACECEHALEG